jgi:hypothetical protein
VWRETSAETSWPEAQEPKWVPSGRNRLRPRILSVATATFIVSRKLRSLPTLGDEVALGDEVD